MKWELETHWETRRKKGHACFFLPMGGGVTASKGKPTGRNLAISWR